MTEPTAEAVPVRRGWPKGKPRKPAPAPIPVAPQPPVQMPVQVPQDIAPCVAKVMFKSGQVVDIFAVTCELRGGLWTFEEPSKISPYRKQYYYIKDSEVAAVVVDQAKPVEMVARPAAVSAVPVVRDPASLEDLAAPSGPRIHDPRSAMSTPIPGMTPRSLVSTPEGGSAIVNAAMMP